MRSTARVRIMQPVRSSRWTSQSMGSVSSLTRLNININIKTRVSATSSLAAHRIVNHQNEDLGKIEELMVDLETGRIAYAVLSFGGFLGLGDKLFAVPWSALTFDTDEKKIVLNVNKEWLKRAPGFDKDNWPDMADRAWSTRIFTYYGYALLGLKANVPADGLAADGVTG